MSHSIIYVKYILFKSSLSAKQKATENDSCLGGKSIQIKLCCLAPGTAWSQPNREQHSLNKNP